MNLKNAPRGAHCGGVEECCTVTRRRRRISQARFFLVVDTKNACGMEISVKNRIFHTRDLCLRALDTNSRCAKSVRRNGE